MRFALPRSALFAVAPGAAVVDLERLMGFLPQPYGPFLLLKTLAAAPIDLHDVANTPRRARYPASWPDRERKLRKDSPLTY